MKKSSVGFFRNETEFLNKITFDRLLVLHKNGFHKDFVEECRRIDFDPGKGPDSSILILLCFSLVEHRSVREFIDIIKIIPMESLEERQLDNLIKIIISFLQKNESKDVQSEIVESVNKEALESKLIAINWAQYLFDKYDADYAMDFLKCVDERHWNSDYYTLKISIAFRMSKPAVAHRIAKTALENCQLNKALISICIQVLCKTDDVDTLLMLLEYSENNFSNDYHLMLSVADGYLALGKIGNSKFVLKNIYTSCSDRSIQVAAFFNMSRLVDPRKYIPLAEDMLREVGDPESEEYLHFSLGNFYEKLECWSLCADHFKNANSLRFARTGREFDFYENQVSKASVLYDVVRRHESRLRKYYGPCVFIVGLPRSGTTFVSDWIYRNIDSKNLEESNVTNQMFQRLSFELDAYQDETIIDRFLAGFSDEWIKSAITGTEPFLESGKFPTLVDKSMSNMIYAPLLKVCFPNSIFIWMSRPLDEHAWAMFKVRFKNTYFTYTSDPLEILKMFKLERRLKHRYKDLALDFIELPLLEFESVQDLVRAKILELDGSWARDAELSTSADRISNTASSAQIRFSGKNRVNIQALKKTIPKLFNKLPLD